MEGEYARLPPKQYPPRARRETAEGKFWRRFGAPELVQCAGAVTHLEYCAAAPHALAATSSVRVQLFDGTTRKLRRTVGRFSDVAYSGSLRADGRLMVAGGERPVVQVFDCGSRAVLRSLQGHSAAVRCARFAPGAGAQHVFSASDDKTCAWWDVTAGARVCALSGHEDYARAACALPGGADVWATGGYDHTVRLWDVRDAARGSTMRLLHAAPVEALLALPSGGMLVSAAGAHVYVWDLLAGGRLLRKIAAAQKTLTCLAYAPLAGAADEHAAGPRLVAGGLDGTARVFELDTWSVTHSARYPAPVTALALNPPCSQLAAGLADGTLVIRMRREGGPGGAMAVGGAGGARAGARRNTRSSRRVKRGLKRGVKLTAANFRYFLRGRQAKVSARAAASHFFVPPRALCATVPDGEPIGTAHTTHAHTRMRTRTRAHTAGGRLRRAGARASPRAAGAVRQAPAPLPPRRGAGRRAVHRAAGGGGGGAGGARRARRG